MKPGDLVRLKGRTSFTGGEVLESGEVGILIERSYLAYESNNSRWFVIFSGEVLSVTEGRLIKVDDNV